jgi:O-glycosyl hydrolase
MFRHWRTRLTCALSAFLIFATLGATQLNVSPAHAAGYTVTVNPAQQYQTIQGWGSSMAWWANIIGGWSTSQKTALANALFSPTTGIGLNVLRYNFGADGPGNVCEKQMQPGANVPTFEPTAGNYVWTNDANQLWFAQAAHTLGADVFEGFVNSPPAWMLLNSCTAGGTKGANNLDPAHYTDFANYIATIDKHFHDSLGITMQTVAPFNEPASQWWSNGTQEGLSVSNANQNTLIPLIETALQQNGASAYTQISAPEDNRISQSINDFNDYSAATKADLVQWNTHTYIGTDAQRQSAYTSIGQGAHKRLWMSEWNDGPSGNQGSQIGAALLLSSHILDDEQNLHPSAWVIWQAVNELGESINGLQGLAYQGPNETISYPSRYYAMGNYSKYVREGSVMLGNSDANSFTAYNAGSQTLTIVTTNSSTSSETVNYNLGGFSSVGAAATPHQTSATENLAQLSNVAIANKAFSTTLPAQSITTFVIPNVSITPVSYDYIVSHSSGQVLDVTGASVTTGVDINQYPNHAGENQQWSLEPLSGGYYNIVNRNSGLVLDVVNASTSNSADVIQAVSTGATSQQWSLVASGGYDEIVNRNSGLLLDVTGASNNASTLIDQYANNGHTNQQWSLVAV